MSELTIEVKGIEELLYRYGKTEGLKILREPMYEALALLVSDLATYPSPPPMSTYRRTGTLGRLWTNNVPEITTSSQGITGRIGNNVEYAPYVQDEERQATIHKHRWQTDMDILKKNETKIIDRFTKTMVKYLA